MSEDLLRYDLLIETALREVVHQAMAKVVQDGLPGDHHFYITFLTHYPGVGLPDYLLEQYPEEMTIVLQYQFFGLQVDDTGFSVMLSFNNVREKMKVPFGAITTFADPSVNFALQFQPFGTEDDSGDKGENKAENDKSADDGVPEGKRGEVISLDLFRKK
jgi:hypothetical protein